MISTLRGNLARVSSMLVVVTEFQSQRKSPFFVNTTFICDTVLPSREVAAWRSSAFACEPLSAAMLRIVGVSVHHR
jgi:hypothetical protein